MRTTLLSLITILCLMLAVSPAMADTYSNGPFNGTNDGWTILVGCEAAFCMSDMDGKLVCENSSSGFFFSPRKRLALSLTLPAPAAEMR